MAGIWFSKGNILGHLATPEIISGDNEGFYVRTDLYFHALIQVDSSQSDQTVDLLTLYSDSSASGSRYKTRIFIKNGLLNVQGSIGTSSGLNGYVQNAVPFDELFELVVTVSPNRNAFTERLIIMFNGVKQTVESPYTNQYMYYFYSYFRAILGGDGSSLGNAKGLLILNATLTNEYNNSAIPQPYSTSTYSTVWHWDFEDSAAPYKIITSRNNVSSELQWTNTDDTTVIWTDTNSPPSSGNGGGIIIPGNGNTTRIQGTVMEDDQPVTRRVFAITQAQLEIDGSQDSRHAVLNSVLSDNASGSYSLDTSSYEGAVIVVAMDDYGEVWQADTAYAVGDVIRPDSFQGYVYICTVSGTGDSTEPTWWFDDSVQSVGTAQFKAKPYTRPLAHGLVTPEIVPES
jgi:hypothetical protein